MTTAAVLGVPLRASAQASTVTLRWNAPPSCPSGEVVRSRVLQLVGPHVTLEASASVTEAQGTYRAALKVRAGESVGERTVDAASCEALADAVAVVVAMAGTTMASPPIAPPAPPVEVAPPPVPLPFPSPALVPAPPLKEEAPLASKPTTPTRPHVRIGVEGSVDLGTLPSATEGVRLSVMGLPRSDVALGVAAELWANRSGSPASLPTQGADFSLLSVDALGCYGAFHRRAFELSGCGIVELDRLSAQGTGPKPQDPTAWWIGLGLGLRGRWELTHAFALTADIDGIVPTAQQQFSIAGPANTTAAIVHVTSIVAGRGHLGGEVRF